MGKRRSVRFTVVGAVSVIADFPCLYALRARLVFVILEHSEQRPLSVWLGLARDWCCCTVAVPLHVERSSTNLNTALLSINNSSATYLPNNRSVIADLIQRARVIDRYRLGGADGGGGG